MKKIINILILLFAVAGATAQTAPICCPEFTLVADFQPCDTTCFKSGNGTPGGPAPANLITACKNSNHVYRVFPNQPGFTYSWTVLGGTPTGFTGNPITVSWGNGTQGTIQVIISDASGNCRDTINKKVCLVDGPIASFTYFPSPVCLSPSTVQFTNTSVGGGVFYWDFGDGNTSTLQNPTHGYTTPGTYTVLLIVSTASAGGPAQQERDCGCRDTASATITVSNLKGIDIYTDDCRKMLCTGDTVKYCTSTTGCTGINWVVNGGTILSGQGTTCITVVWNQPSTYPTTVTLNANCPNTCGNSATLNVPVLYPNLPIQGPTPVCYGSTTTYSLPVLPGTFYKWTLSGGGTIAGPDSNTNLININWTAFSGTFTITCIYKNPYSGCSGSSTKTVTIKPKFELSGLGQSCTGLTSTMFVVGGGLANWLVSPTTGYTPPGTPAGTFTSLAGLALTWSTAGTYAINAVPVTPANYCTSSASLNIIVNPTPVLNPITGPSPVCVGQLYDYTASSNVSGGTFNWIFTSGTGTISPYGPNNSSASIIFAGAGPWTLKVDHTVNGCTGTISKTITKVAPPSAITLAPGASVCSGGTVTATISGPLPPGGVVWSATPGAVLTGGQGTLSATFTVNSSATITVTNCSGSSTISVTATPAAVTITRTNTPCGATLTASPGGGTYTWYLNGSPVGTGNPLTITQNGTYVLQAAYSGGCMATNQIIVTGITPITANITATGNLCTGSVTLQAGIPVNCPSPTYTWSNGATGNPITVTTPGTYYVTITCSNGCSAVSNSIIVNPCPTGGGQGNCINDLNISPSTCPNPVNLTVTTIPAGCTPVSTTWFYGDGFSDNTGVHLYANVGSYTVYVVITCSDGSVHCGSRVVTIPIVTAFTSVISCGTNGWSIQLQDASILLPGPGFFSRVWSTTCGSLSSTSSANPILTVPLGCNPTVTLTVSRNGCAVTKSFTFNFPTTSFIINGPSTVCKGENNTFSSSFTTGIISYNWDFGDLTSGVTNPITHAFDGTPPNPTINLQIKDQYGCIFTTTKNITVVTPRALNITPSPLVKICPDCAPPVTLSTAPTTGFSGYQWYQNGNSISGANSATYQLCNFNASGTYYVTAIDNLNNNCSVKSNSVQVVYLPKPVADIQGSTIQCSGSLPAFVSLQNSINDPNSTYLWAATGPGTVTFSPNNTQYNVGATVSAYGTYQFILTVTDIITGCIAKDTFCVLVFQSPSVTVTGPSGNLCEGTPYTFTATATPPNPGYIYLWSNGATGPSMTTSQAGTYTVTVMNPVSGCTGFGYAGQIKKCVNLQLFPLGCDTLCDTAKIIPPLPLGPGQNYAGLYNIDWFVDGVFHSTGPVLNLSSLPLGAHSIYIVVTNLLTGCSCTSGKYDIFIKHCVVCDCTGSHWGEIVLNSSSTTKSETGQFTPTVVNSISGKENNAVLAATNLTCGNTYNLICNQPYSINASYLCKDTTCPSKVTYSLQPPTGPAIPGTNIFNFTPMQTGTYTLTIYGWCGGKICDSCIVTFVVQCDCDCNGSTWTEKLYTINNVTKNITCDKINAVDVKCNDVITINAGFSCAAVACNSPVTYILQPPTGASSAGSVPLTFTASLPGTYTVTLYGWCGTKKCDSCTVLFKTDCVVDTNCCKYDIKIKDTSIITSVLTSPSATVATGTFGFTGPAGNLFTQIRAEVVSYDLVDNYNKACISCKSYPFTWASMYTPAPIGTLPPGITLYNSTVTSFNPSGAGMYKNPREVIWSSNAPIALPTSIGLSFLLPPASIIQCCALTAKICVKFVFRDKDCRECEVLVCFEVPIKI